jgi:hypothetical protein
MNRPALPLVAFAFLTLAIAGDCRAVWTKLAAEGDILPGASALPGFSAADTVRNNGVRDLRFSPSGNFVATVNTDPSQGNTTNAGTFYLWGSTDFGTSHQALRREGVVSGTSQVAFGTPTAIDDAGNVFYRVTETTPSNPVGPGSLWRNATRLLGEGDAVTAPGLTGNVYTGFGNAAVTPAGVERWVSSYAATAAGPDLGGALFQNAASPTAILKSGDSIGGGMTITSDFLNGNLAWSLHGTNYLAGVDFSASTLDSAIVLNGQVVPTLGGGVLRDGDAIPAAAGGLPNETWSIGSLVAVNEAGDWIVSASAQINATGNTTRDFLVMNGQIVYADGQTVDGHTLSGLPSHVSLNDRGDVGFVWDNKAFVNGQIVAEVGDLTDTNGDGTGDAAISAIFDIDLTNLNSVEPGGTPLMYLQARVGSLEGVFRNAIPTVPGDFNGDNRVDGADLSLLLANWGAAVGSRPTGWLGVAPTVTGIDADELSRLLSTWGVGTSTTIPEPASLLVVAPVVGFARRARRR